MNRNCSNITYRFHIPDFPEKLFLCKNSVWILCQECEQIKFLGGKSFLLAIYPDAAGSLVDLAVAMLVLPEDAVTVPLPGRVTVMVPEVFG